MDDVIMTGCEFSLDPYGTTRYVFLILGLLGGFLISMYLFLKMKKTPKIISFETNNGILRLYRIGHFYYTKEDYDKNLTARKVYGEI